MKALAIEHGALCAATPTELTARITADGRHEREVGYTAGVFDMLHVGHRRHLEQARARCERLIVGVTTDELCGRRKHKTPIVSYEERAEMLRGFSRCLAYGLATSSTPTACRAHIFVSGLACLGLGFQPEADDLH